MPPPSLMQDPTFFPRGNGLTLQAVADLVGGSIGAEHDATRTVTGIAALGEAGPDDLTFFDSPRYAGELSETRAGCVVVAQKHHALVPAGIPAVIVKNAANAFAAAGRALFPMAAAPTAPTCIEGLSARAEIHPLAEIEDGATIEAFAVIGPRVRIGRGTLIAAGAVIGADCRIGRDCRIGAGVVATNALLGNRVILHPGVRIGQDGFGYTAGATGLSKSVQIGRVIIQDDVEVGANTTIDRGAIRDTVVGEGTKIDNQVQIGHNVRIGRHCAIVAQVGISGSTTVGDRVMIGGQSGVAGHVTIGDGAQIAAVSSVNGDVPPGARWGGTPARPVREWFREVTYLHEQALKGRSQRSGDE